MTAASLTRVPSPALTDKQVYRLLFTATFLIFLVSVVIQRVVRLFRESPAAPVKSIFAEARETASSTLLIAFMG